MPAIVSANLPNIYWLAGIWIFGGLIALIGALCFAELTTTYPDAGGDYGYLKRSYHRRVGFAFSWAAFWVIRPGNIGAMSLIFGEFAVQVFPGSLPDLFYAIASVVCMSSLNMIGVTFGKTTQNVLTVAKVVGILVIVAAAFFIWNDSPADGAETGTETAVEATQSTEVTDVSQNVVDSQNDSEVTSESVGSIWSSFWLAMVFVMFTFGGWNDIAFVASEVKDRKRNLLRALVIGTACVSLIYLLVNFALVYGMGFERMSELGANWKNPTSVLVEERMGARGNLFFATLVCVSCLGAINAMIFTSPRIYCATAADYPGLGWLTGSRRESGWWRTMLLQAIITTVFICTFASKEGIETITAATAPYFWLFLALTVVGLMICRVKFSGQFSGYRVPLYPITPLLFVSVCAFMGYQSWVFMVQKQLGWQALFIGLWVAVGIGLSFFMVHRPEDSGPSAD
jgi:amino acid transporter